MPEDYVETLCPASDDDYPSRFTLTGEPVHLQRLVFSARLRELAERTAGGGGHASGDYERAERLFQRENGIAIGEVVMPWRMLMRDQAQREGFQGAAPSWGRRRKNAADQIDRNYGAGSEPHLMDHGHAYFMADGGAHVLREDPEDRFHTWHEWQGSEPACLVGHPYNNPFIGREVGRPGPTEYLREMPELKAIFVDFPSWHVAGDSVIFLVVRREVEIVIE